MLWAIGIVAGVGLLFLVLRKRGSPVAQGSPGSGSFVIRNGQAVAADQTFDAWMSGDLGKMLRALKTQTNAVDRHFLRLIIVEAAYKNRSDPRSRSLCIETARRHLTEFPRLAPALKREMGGTLPQVPTFKHLCTIYTEDGKLDEAIRVCELALGYGLDDGTAGGFRGRIERPKKKQQSSRGAHT